jgi:hypothetical protein
MCGSINGSQTDNSVAAFRDLHKARIGGVDIVRGSVHSPRQVIASTVYSAPMNADGDDIGLFDFGQTFRGNVPRERPAIPEVLIQHRDLVRRQAIAALESFIEVKTTTPGPIVDVRQGGQLVG